MMSHGAEQAMMRPSLDDFEAEITQRRNNGRDEKAEQEGLPNVLRGSGGVGRRRVAGLVQYSPIYSFRPMPGVYAIDVACSL
jgi:hypothetical protein